VLTDEKYRERHLNPARARRALGETFLSGASDTFGEPSPLVPTSVSAS